MIPDTAILAKTLRKADKDEVLAVCNMEPKVALLQSYALSTECYTAYRADTKQPLAMFGYVRMQPKVSATIWMLGSDELLEFRSEFLRKSKEWTADFQAKNPLLYNLVDLRNKVHIRWLQWLGFKFIRVVPEYGPYNLPFVEFCRIKT